MIKTEIRENPAFEAFTAWGWETEKTEKVFVDEEGREVFCRTQGGRTRRRSRTP